MKAELHLADWAEVMQGKLYAQGLGWSHTRADFPMSFAVVILGQLEFSELGEKRSLELLLERPGNGPFLSDEGQEIRAGFQFVIGKADDQDPSEPQPFALAANVLGIRFPVGKYVWTLTENGAPIATLAFNARG